MSSSRKENRIIFDGKFGLDEIHHPLALIHHAIQSAGYQDLVVDFSHCEAAFAPAMLGLCAQVMKLRSRHIDTQLIMPRSEKLKRLFINTNWAHLLDPRSFDPSTFRGHKLIPATQFGGASEQFDAVNKIVNVILGALPNLERGDFAALEWSINEVIDNVNVHADSPIGGLVQVTTFESRTKVIEYVVADAGLGIPATLRAGHPEIKDDMVALEMAIREGITRDKNVGQGNGLFGSYEICSQSGGQFRIDSGHARLSYDNKSGLHVSNEKIPFEGSLIVARIDLTKPHLLEEALKFGGKKTVHYDFVEKNYEANEGAEVILKIATESPSFGSRIAGQPIRTKIMNLIRMCPGQRIIVDFTDVPIVSSSFADEVLGKLFKEIGVTTFMSRVSLINMDRTVRALVDKAIAQRMATDESR